uniref:Uncharacterized protein n=1 Tax=Romanomermis culicivorax TaxID=13658 RepID=A0A915JAQ0_ROMCU
MTHWRKQSVDESDPVAEIGRIFGTNLSVAWPHLLYMHIGESISKVKACRETTPLVLNRGIQDGVIFREDPLQSHLFIDIVQKKCLKYVLFT